MWQARRTAMIRPPASVATPQCGQFALCGGCQLQELGIEAQRVARTRKAMADIEAKDTSLADVTIHPTRFAADTYNYRNKVELSFGVSRYLSEADHAKGFAIDGRFLGFHAPGRFDRVVDAPRCEIAKEPLNAVLERTREVLLPEDGPALYDVRDNTGFLRHLLLRLGVATGEVMAVLYTATPTSDAEREAAMAWGEAVSKLTIEGATVTSVQWAINDGVADVARGATEHVWGQERIHERLGDVIFDLSATSFFQTNTAGAIVLYDTIGEALTSKSRTLLDLYCGTGSIGLYLASRVDTVIGIEEREDAVEDARRNAERSGVTATFTAGKVEHHLDSLAVPGAALVVDPPRVGLHPKVAKALATADADELIYVACSPASLGRDAVILQAGHWKLTDLWTVDLFPHTGHIEMVGRFVRQQS
ncbi:MAG: 23S rRNA (uracil1939-C5)-methyltransferase [Myxococcota bacterium]|jgi:23S rRNA (uracil1939-C5)-methyltransferase